MTLKDKIGRFRWSWQGVNQKFLILLALWLSFFLLTACLILGRVILLRPSQSQSGDVRLWAQGFGLGITPTPSATSPDKQTESDQAVLITETVYPSEDANDPMFTQTDVRVIMRSGTPVTVTPRPGGGSGTSGSGQEEYGELTPVFRITQYGSPTATWYIRYFTPRPTIYIPYRTPTRTYTPRPSFTPVPPTLQPTYKTATAASYLTATATRQTATQAMIETRTVSAGQTGTASVIGTQTMSAQQTATTSANQTATAIAQKPLAYSADNNGDSRLDIKVVNLDGTQFLTIFTSPAEDANGAVMGDWWPDRSWIIFEGWCGNPSTHTLCRIHPDGSGLESVTNLPAGQNAHPAVSPNGDWVLFKNTSPAAVEDLCFIHPDGSELTCLKNISAHTWNAWDADWRTDDEIVFVSDKDGSVDIYTLGIQDVLIPSTPPVPLTDPERRTENADIESSPHFSPADDTQLIYARSDGAQWDLYLGNIDDLGSSQQLTDDVLDDWQPAWSDDGSKIIFVSNRNGRDELFIYNLADASQTAVPNTQSIQILRPNWMP